MAFNFGVGTLQVSGASLFSVAKLQNVSINISFENAQLRGSSDIFPCNTQFFDGSVEGSFEHGDIELSQIAQLISSAGSFAGAGGSGTLTMTGTVKPQAFKLVLSGVTNGVTSTITIHRVFIPSLTLDFTRTEYMIPAMNFIAEAGTTGLLTWTQ